MMSKQPRSPICAIMARTIRRVAALALCWLMPLAVGAQPASTVGAEPEAVPTRVLVRVVAQGAKVLGDGVGGARVTIRDLASGQMLARGRQRGSTGDTERIMRQAHAPGDTLYATPGTAGYEATLMLQRPTRVEIVGEGPLGHPEAARRAATTMLLVPGRDVLGDGVVLTVHGFVVEVLEPKPDAAATRASPGDSLRVRATVAMMCGCPTTPGGLWDSDQIDVQARLVREGRVLAEVPLRYAGTPSTYAGALPQPARDAKLREAEVQVVAADAAQANFGLLSFALASPLRAQSQEQAAMSDSAQVVQAVEQFREALVAGDSAAAASMLAPEALILESGGQETKPEYLRHHFHSDHAFLNAMTREPRSRTVRVEGAKAWAASTSRLQGRYEDRDLDVSSAELMVLRRTPAGWKIAAIHWSSRSRP